MLGGRGRRGCGEGDGGELHDDSELMVVSKCDDGNSDCDDELGFTSGTCCLIYIFFVVLEISWKSHPLRIKPQHQESFR